jgi:hypothetical protein
MIPSPFHLVFGPQAVNHLKMKEEVPTWQQKKAASEEAAQVVAYAVIVFIAFL